MSAPYNFDTGNPTTTMAVASFPANEQTFRSTVAGIVGGVIDPNTGYPYLTVLTAAPTAGTFTNPPTGMIVATNISSVYHLYVNFGTPASPNWQQV